MNASVTLATVQIALQGIMGRTVNLVAVQTARCLQLGNLSVIRIPEHAPINAKRVGGVSNVMTLAIMPPDVKVPYATLIQVSV